MSLYTPPVFGTATRAAIARLIHDYPFATLVTPGAIEPRVSHVPLLLVSSTEPHGTLLGHVARANPHWREAAGRESVAIFQGPHAYVSPAWYAEPAKAVPTWNYAAVHAYGTVEPVDDPVEAQAILDALVERFEGGRVAPWRLALAPRERDAMVGAIVAFRMRVRRLDAKFKLSQNRSPDDRRRVIAGLGAEAHPDAQATATWMASYADPSSDGAT